LSLQKESSKEDGESLWGKGQLPLEAKESKILMFDVRAISLHHSKEINTISNTVVKKASNKARATVI
jgi:hypothetical protein